MTIPKLLGKALGFTFVVFYFGGCAYWLVQDTDWFGKTFRPCTYWTQKREAQSELLEIYERDVLDCDSLPVLLARIGGFNALRESDEFRFLDLLGISLESEDDSLGSSYDFSVSFCEQWKQMTTEQRASVAECDSVIATLKCEDGSE